MERIAYEEINGYFISVQTVIERSRSIGYWRRLRLNCLKEQRPIMFLQLLKNRSNQENGC